MQLIRAINKSNKSNNNNNNSNGSANQTSSNNNTTNKVVIVAPPTNSHQNQQQQHSGATSSSLQVSRNANKNSAVQQQPVSPSASLPPLKKRTTIVKQAVPPPPPPRKSSPAPPPRSSKSNLNPYCTSRIIVDVDRLQCLSEMEIESGNLKVKQWLESVELLPTTTASLFDDEISIRDEVTFKGVKKLIESFSTIKEEDQVDVDEKVGKFNNVLRSKRKISDSSCCLVKARVEGYKILENKARNQSNVLKSETDSGIEISSKSNCLLRFHHQFSRDGEFV